jgi:hypothetical protein
LADSEHSTSRNLRYTTGNQFHREQATIEHQALSKTGFTIIWQV